MTKTYTRRQIIELIPASQRSKLIGFGEAVAHTKMMLTHYNGWIDISQIYNNIPISYIMGAFPDHIKHMIENYTLNKQNEIVIEFEDSDDILFDLATRS